MRTRDSRGVLPKKLSYKEAVAASSIANVAVAALLAGDMVTAGQAIEGDLFHERYRQDLGREFATIKQVAKENGAYATYLLVLGRQLWFWLLTTRRQRLRQNWKSNPSKENFMT